MTVERAFRPRPCCRCGVDPREDGTYLCGACRVDPRMNAEVRWAKRTAGDFARHALMQRGWRGGWTRHDAGRAA